MTTYIIANNHVWAVRLAADNGININDRCQGVAEVVISNVWSIMKIDGRKWDHDNDRLLTNIDPAWFSGDDEATYDLIRRQFRIMGCPTELPSP